MHSGFSMWSGPPTAHDNVRPAVAEQSVRFDTAVPTLPNHCHHFHVKHRRVLEEGTGKCGCDMLHSSLAACRQMKRSHWTGGLALKGAWSWRLAAARRCLNFRAPLLHSWRRFTETQRMGFWYAPGTVYFFPPHSGWAQASSGWRTVFPCVCSGEPASLPGHGICG